MSDAPDLSSRLLQEQVRLLARNVPALVSGTMLAATGTAALLVANDFHVSAAITWWSATLVLCAVRLLMARFYARGSAAWTTAHWARWFVVSSAVAGVLWGSLAAFAFDADDVYAQAVVAIMLAGIVSSATQSLGPYFPAHLAFALPTLLPLAARCLSSDTAKGLLLGFLILAFLLMAEVFARRIAMTIADAMRLRFENEALAKALALERDKAEAANQTKSQFLATASHDLRQPIHALALYVPALKSLAGKPHELLRPGALASVADRMDASLTSVSQLLTRLLDVSRLDAGTVDVAHRAVALDGVFDRCMDQVQVAAQRKGLRLRCRGRHLTVQTDAAVLQTIISNLLGNAVRYTERGGVLLGARRRGTQVLIQVWDSGIGIADDEQHRITDAFFQARNAHNDASQSRGFGLGLAIVSRSAQLLGTGLNWRSRLGRGSVFELLLPIATDLPASAPSHRRATESPPERAPGLKDMPKPQVLVIDSDPAILSSMGFLLQAWRFEPLLASNLAEAAPLVQQAGPRLCAAFVDYHLSAQFTGLDAARMLHGIVGTSLPVAIVTGDTTREVMHSVKQAGLRLMHKPAQTDAMLEFLRTADPAA